MSKDAGNLAATPPNRTAAPRPISRRRRFTFIILILTVFAAGQEALCRWLFPLPEAANFNRINYTPLAYFSGDVRAAGVRGLSNVKIRWESEPDGFAFDHTLNLYGFRGPDFAIAPPPGRPRVLFVGDSFVEGCGAADADTLPAQFMQLLHDDRIEAINLGVAAADLPEYAMLVRDGVRLLRPEAVFLVVCANDLPADPRPLVEIAKKQPPEFEFLSHWAPRAVQLFRQWKNGGVVPRRFPSGPFPFFAPVPARTNPLTVNKPPDNIDPTILDAMKRGTANPWNAGVGHRYEGFLRQDYATEGAKPYLQYIASRCNEGGARLIVVYVPHHAAVNPLYIPAENRLGGPGWGDRTSADPVLHRAQQRHLRRVCEELAIPILDTTDEFIAAEKMDRLFWPVDAHCNARGYRLLAEICCRFWIDGATPPRVGP